MCRPLALLVLLATALPAAAAPTVLRDGANHHLGDDSFVARFGRSPTPADAEALRMTVHLTYVRDLLARRPATSPALAPRRAALLGYLDDYVAKGVTPRNTYVARRNPVFIDRDGNICAVGYLIERSVGRALPETIAAAHRLDYLEDIAAAMPEVDAWVAASGFTLDELASIQPGYEGPDVQHQRGWVTQVPAEDAWQVPFGVALPPDGPYRDEATGIAGRVARGQMVGAWTRTVGDRALGKGTFVRGAGTWTSYRADGTRLATGPFVRSHPHGTWRFFHPSGRLAAMGAMRDGARHGRWTFHVDRAGSPRLSVGRFSHGEAVGPWRHFDATGKLVATATGRAGVDGLTLDVEPGPRGVRHEVHRGIPADDARLDGLYLGKTRLYVDQLGTMFDGDARQLERRGDGTWVARACAWSARRRAAARRADATALHRLLLERATEACDGEASAMPAKLAARYDRMLVARRDVHGPVPAFAWSSTASDAGADADTESAPPTELAGYLAHHMAWYLEWPHVDDGFRAVYATLPGYAGAMTE